MASTLVTLVEGDIAINPMGDQTALLTGSEYIQEIAGIGFSTVGSTSFSQGLFRLVETSTASTYVKQYLWSFSGPGDSWDARADTNKTSATLKIVIALNGGTNKLDIDFYEDGNLLDSRTVDDTGYVCRAACCQLAAIQVFPGPYLDLWARSTEERITYDGSVYTFPWDGSEEVARWHNLDWTDTAGKIEYSNSAYGIVSTTALWPWPPRMDVLRAEPGAPVWIHRADGADHKIPTNLYEGVWGGAETTIGAGLDADHPSAWIQSGGRRYVAFDRAGNCEYIYYDEDTWSDPVTIRADRIDPAAIPLPASRDVMIICKDASENLKLNMLRWNGTDYTVETEIDVGVRASDTGGGWVQTGGTVYLAYIDTDGAAQEISSDLSGVAWA